MCWCRLSSVTDVPYVAQVMEKRCWNDSRAACKSFVSHLIFCGNEKNDVISKDN